MKEFITRQYHSNLPKESSDLIKHAGSASQNAYLDRWGQFYENFDPQKTADTNLADTISTIQTKRQNGEIKWSTVRQYKAAIMFTLSLAYLYRENPSLYQQVVAYKKLVDIERFHPFFNAVTTPALEDNYEELNNWKSSDPLVTKQLDNLAHEKNNTSSSKAKSFPDELYNILMKDTSPNMHWVRVFTYLNCRLGLRPNEWYDCELVSHDYYEVTKSQQGNPFFNGRFQDTNNQPVIHFSEPNDQNSAFTYGFLEKLGVFTFNEIKDKSAPVLVVKNSKLSHGRACGPLRFIALTGFNATEVDLLKTMMGYFDRQNDELNTDGTRLGFVKHVINPMQGKLHYFWHSNDDAEIAINDVFEQKHEDWTNEKNRYLRQGKEFNRTPPVKNYPTLYSTRHQAIATAKATGCSPIEIAALFGHASVITADRHYGKRIHGWGKQQVQPVKEGVMNVLVRMTDAVFNQIVSESAPGELVQAVAEQLEQDGVIKAPDSFEDAVKQIMTQYDNQPDVFNERLSHVVKTHIQPIAAKQRDAKTSVQRAPVLNNNYDNGFSPN